MKAAKVRDERLPAEHLVSTAAATICCSAMYISKQALGMRVAEDLGVGRVRDLAVERDDVAPLAAERRERLAVGLARTFEPES